MRILVTNDDGIHAEGLAVLVRELSTIHDVFVFAPDQERSGISHAMTLRNPGKVRKLGEREYSCSGTPADCVILTGLGAIPFIPEVVVAGINRGPNLGTDIIYSGTCGAARQAALGGLPGIAVSCATYREPFIYEGAASFVRRRIDRLIELCEPGIFVNINAPSIGLHDLPGEWAMPCKRRYMDRLRSFEGPDGYTYCFLADSRIETLNEEHSDHDVVAAGKVSVSAILVHPQVASCTQSGREFR
jgi:5'-nucleotidase